MTHKLRDLLLRGLLGLAMAACAALPLRAAIQHGVTLTNSADAEQRRLDDFYKAEQSLQQKVRVGQERYDAKQAERAKTIAVMNEQLQARERSVTMTSAEPAKKESDSPTIVSRSNLAIVVFIIVFASIIYFWRRGLPLDFLSRADPKA